VIRLQNLNLKLPEVEVNGVRRKTEEKKAIIAFLDAITEIPYKMDRPQLPQ
jgi:hypothetical protein